MKNRKVRKLQYIQLKNKLKDNLFDSMDYLGPQTQWADICFIGKNKDVYNATVETTLCAWHQIIEHEARKCADKLTSHLNLFEFKNKTFYNPTLKELGNKHYFEYCEAKEKEISQTNPPVISESFKILNGFNYGIGLNIVVHAPHLTVESINHAILKFLELGEKNWVSNKKFTFEYKKHFSFSTNILTV